MTSSATPAHAGRKPKMKRPIQGNITPLALTVPGVAAALGGIGQTSVWRLIKEKQLHAVKVLGRTLVPIAEIERFLNEKQG